SGRDLLLQGGRQRIDIDLEANRERGLRRNAGTDAAILLARDRLVQLKRVAPEFFAAERVITEDLLALLHHRLRITCDIAVESLFGSGGVRHHGSRHNGYADGRGTQVLKLHRHPPMLMQNSIKWTSSFTVHRDGDSHRANTTGRGLMPRPSEGFSMGGDADMRVARRYESTVHR